MNKTIGFMVAVFVVLAIAARHIIGENQDLKAENAAYRKANANLLNGYMAMKLRSELLASELGATEDAAEQERETP